MQRTVSSERSVSQYAFSRLSSQGSLSSSIVRVHVHCNQDPAPTGCGMHAMPAMPASKPHPRCAHIYEEVRYWMIELSREVKLRSVPVDRSYWRGADLGSILVSSIHNFC